MTTDSTQNPLLQSLHLYCNLLGERLADAGVGSQTAQLTGHALDALLRLEDGDKLKAKELYKVLDIVVNKGLVPKGSLLSRLIH